MKTIRFALAVHNHQPIGNFDQVFEEAFQRSYRPFVDVLERHPGVKFTQHWTGPLLEWLLTAHPDFVDRLQGLVGRGQLEILTGSYYEAVLAIIPERDRIGQIRKLTGMIQSRLGTSPTGMWLAERVWEQQLAASLVRAGVRFVVIDDTHFRHAGLRDEQLLGYYITEEQGETLAVLPIDKTLRYTIPFRPVEETRRYLEGLATDEGNRVVIHADDGEKFGVWPKTFRHVYEEGWLEAFCTMLEEHSAWIRPVHLSTILATLPPLGRIYLPNASYPEMMKWVLEPASFQNLEGFEEKLKEARLFEGNAMFVRGGFWRNFLAKYPEANHMHKRMLRISKRAEKVATHAAVSPRILDHLWAGQCNDAYWHGVFGGLYLPNLRYAVYHNLLLAEAGLDHAEKLPPVRSETTDFDCDGQDEILVESDVLNLYLKPAEGGCLVELDFKPAALNLLDIVSRREEGYHKRLTSKDAFKDKASIHDGVLVKEEGLEKHLAYDWYRHASLQDHFFGREATLEGVAGCAYPELGDFVNQPYEAKVQKFGDEIRVTLERDGAVWSGDMPHRLKVRKIVRYVGGAKQFTVDYTITNLESTDREIWFGIECNVGLMAGDAHDRFYRIPGRDLADRRLRSRGEECDVDEVELVDEWLKVRTVFRMSRPATLWRFPIETVSLSEQGFERLYQSSVVLPHWKLDLKDEFHVRITQSITRM
jgi:alpha-amylase/alpha-mannosidase (GH57 family)